MRKVKVTYKVVGDQTVRVRGIEGLERATEKFTREGSFTLTIYAEMVNMDAMMNFVDEAIRERTHHSFDNWDEVVVNTKFTDIDFEATDD